MFSDPEARGGILEPAGIIKIKFCLADKLKAMQHIDSQFQMIDAEIEATDEMDGELRSHQGADRHEGEAPEAHVPPGRNQVCQPPRQDREDEGQERHQVHLVAMVPATLQGARTAESACVCSEKMTIENENVRMEGWCCRRPGGFVNA